MRKVINNQKGAVLIIFALSLIVLLGFVALGIEAGRFYLTQAELAKAVDAASLAGAENYCLVNCPYDIVALTTDFGLENFQPGYLGTPQSGGQSVTFTVTTGPEPGMVNVEGRAYTRAIFAQLFGIGAVQAGKTGGRAQKNEVQIMLVLDRSYSMNGTPLADLKKAALGFLEYYRDTEAEDEMGLVSFATGAKVNFAVGHNYYTPIYNAINALATSNQNNRMFTNAMDALNQAGDSSRGGLSDQSGVIPANRKSQYILFFTDGHPTAFRSTFTRNGTNYDAVVHSEGNCTSNSENMETSLWNPATESDWNTSTLRADPTGDGKPTSGTDRTVCPRPNWWSPIPTTTKWGSFSRYPIVSPPYRSPGLGTERYPQYCSISSDTYLDGQNGYVCRTARQMAIDSAATLKARFIKIYAIGLGNVDSSFLSAVATPGSDYVNIAPDSSDLEAIFKKIAKEIKLRLVL